MCYSEWQSGDFSKIKLTSDDHKTLFISIRERVMCDWEDRTYQDGIRARFRQWVRQSTYVLTSHTRDMITHSKYLGWF